MVRSKFLAGTLCLAVSYYIGMPIGAADFVKANQPETLMNSDAGIELLPAIEVAPKVQRKARVKGDAARTGTAGDAPTPGAFGASASFTSATSTSATSTSAPSSTSTPTLVTAPSWGESKDETVKVEKTIQTKTTGKSNTLNFGASVPAPETISKVSTPAIESITESVKPAAAKTVTSVITPTTVETVSKTETPTATETVTKISTPTANETVTKIESAKGTETITKVQTPVGTETVTEVLTPNAVETITKVKTPTASETITKVVTPGETETVTKVETKAGTETVTKIETPSGTETITKDETPGKKEAFTTVETTPANTDAAAVKTGEGSTIETTAIQPKSLPPTEALAVATPSVTPVLPGCIIIDNDEEGSAAVVQEVFEWKELPDSAGKTKLVTGATFPVRVVSSLNSKTAKVGDVVEGMTRVDLKVNGKMIAGKGTRVVGHVFSVMPARRILHAEMSRDRWFRANGEIGIQFDELITEEKEHIPLVVKPAQAARIVDNRAEGRLLGVNHKGEVATPLSSQLKAQALHLAIRGAASSAGIFSMGAVPVAYAAVGALNPSFAFLHPVGQNVRHRRLKGAAMGFVSGAPGGFLLADMIIKGSEAQIKPGDEFLVEFKKDFTGESGGDAEMIDAGKKDVKGEVVGRRGGKKK